MWPSFWIDGGDPWPERGEIDLIENIDRETYTYTALHTNNKCSMEYENASALMTRSWRDGPDGAIAALVRLSCHPAGLTRLSLGPSLAYRPSLSCAY